MRFRRLLGCLALILAPLPALAQTDTLTLTYTSFTGGSLCTSGCTKTLSGPSGVNVLALLIATYQSACNATQATACTQAQVMTWWAGSIGAKLQADILANQQNAAAVAVPATPVQ